MLFQRQNKSELENEREKLSRMIATIESTMGRCDGILLDDLQECAAYYRQRWEEVNKKIRGLR